MMPPISGMQAMAAATFEGKPVDVGFGPVSGPGLGGGGGWFRSAGSGMTYIHKLGVVLSSNLPPLRSNSLSLTCRNDYRVVLIAPVMTRNSLRGFTLIELITIIAFLAVLASFAYPVYMTALERAKITQDMNNLRQIGLATQSYLSDNDNNLFSSSTSWMSELHPKYLPGWNVFRSPFDNPVPPRTALENDTNSAVSYGFNGNPSPVIIGMAAAKISNPSVFILFAPAQTSASTVTFQGTAGTGAPGVTVYKAASSPGGSAIGGTHSSRKQINAVFADLHSENMLWSVFINDAPNSSDPWAAQRWSP